MPGREASHGELGKKGHEARVQALRSGENWAMRWRGMSLGKALSEEIAIQ